MADCIIYNKEESTVLSGIGLDLASQEVSEEYVKWIIAGLDEDKFVTNIATHFGIHHLIIEDFFNNSHLPKFEVFEDHYFLTLKIMDYSEEEDSYLLQHTSLILKNNILFCFTVNPANIVLEDVKKRIQESIGFLRLRGADYLFYRIIDLIVDQYIGAVNIIRNTIDDLEDRTVEGDTSDITPEILDLKRKISSLRRIMEPLREEIIRLKNTAPGLIDTGAHTYFQDILDHLNSGISALESFRDILTDMMELRLAQVSHSMNQVMKTLTVVSTLFIPLTFLAGVYGMNFPGMPEMHWKWGYPFFWILILITGLIMLLYMRSKKWF
ncbi:MAG: magnesium/cobalt transporter CorA [Bacteroidales bacterium]|nr:magnesium/cobalt transporter CorA [Bacteroidales bacterium]MCB8998612.1 magnesium/cobalt transporter CorA [Bacteroidales bacterium]MCB9012520.1 magnesium/cobalt transporter CorA [Bacteroidales bacterium]